MDAKFQAILDSLPPKLPRSKLDPDAELIREFRKRDRSYREITGLLNKRCGLNVGVHTLYSFVRTRGIGEGEMDEQANQNPVIGDAQDRSGESRRSDGQMTEQAGTGVPPSGSTGRNRQARRRNTGEPP